MADLRVDYQLLTSIHRSLGALSRELADIDDQVSGYGAAFGSDAITSAMAGFSGNWSHHRSALLSAAESLGQMTAATEERFRHADSQLASDLVTKK